MGRKKIFKASNHVEKTKKNKDSESESDSELSNNSDELQKNENKINDKPSANASSPPEPVVRKRGRPKKNVNQSSSKSKQQKLSIQDIESIQEKSSIPLHIPLYDDSSSETSKNQFTMKGESDIEDHDTSNKHKLIMYLSDEDNDNDGNVKTLKKELKKKNDLIKRLKNEMYTKSDTYVNQNNSMQGDSEYSKLIPIKFFSIKDNKCIISEKTDTVCFWCTYNFNNIPCFIPDKYYDGIYYVFGNFCSYQCALAYIMRDDEYKRTNRISLIKKLYCEITGVAKNLLPADDREVLVKFKGFKTIDEFRDFKTLDTITYKKKLGNMSYIPMYYEEIYHDIGYIKSKSFK